MGEITAIVDHNKLQSDYRVSQTSDLGDLTAKFASFGWHVERCDGHDLDALRRGASRLCSPPRAPTGRSSPTRSRAGASPSWSTPRSTPTPRCTASIPARPTPDSYAAGAQELLDDVNVRSCGSGAARLSLETAEPPAKAPVRRHEAADPGLYRGALDARGAGRADRGARRRPRARYWTDPLQGAVSRPLRRMRHRRDGYGLAGRRHGAAGTASRSAIPSPASCRRGRTSRSTTTRPSGRRCSMLARSRASSRRRPATAISLCATSLRSLRCPTSISSSRAAPRRCRCFLTICSDSGAERISPAYLGPLGSALHLSRQATHAWSGRGAAGGERPRLRSPHMD